MEQGAVAASDIPNVLGKFSDVVRLFAGNRLRMDILLARLNPNNNPDHEINIRKLFDVVSHICRTIIKSVHDGAIQEERAAEINSDLKELFNEIRNFMMCPSFTSQQGLAYPILTKVEMYERKYQSLLTSPVLKPHDLTLPQTAAPTAEEEDGITVVKRRKLNSSMVEAIELAKISKIANTVLDTIPVEDHQNSTIDETSKKNYRTQSFFINTTFNWTDLQNEIFSKLANPYKALLAGDRIKITTQTENDYCILKTLLTSKNYEISLTPQAEKSMEIAIKGLPQNFDVMSICKELCTLGFHCNKIPVFSSCLDPIINKHASFYCAEIICDSNFDKVYDITTLFNFAIRIEPFFSEDYGYCLFTKALPSYKCLMCGSDYATLNCLEPNASAKCCNNCGGNHLSNCKNCPRNFKYKSEIHEVATDTTTQLKTNKIIADSPTLNSNINFPLLCPLNPVDDVTYMNPANLTRETYSSNISETSNEMPETKYTPKFSSNHKETSTITYKSIQTQTSFVELESALPAEKTPGNGTPVETNINRTDMDSNKELTTVLKELVTVLKVLTTVHSENTQKGCCNIYH